MSHEQRLRTIRHALAHAASLGVTSIQDMNDEYRDSYADIEAYSVAQLHVIASVQPTLQLTTDAGPRPAWARSRQSHLYLPNFS
jgi:predicted amidohydrolase YtcJ